MAERTALANGKSPVILESQSKRIVPECRLRGVSIVLASFCCNGILFGVINTYSVIYAELFDRLKSAGVEEASAKASLVGSLAMGTTFLLSPISGILTDRIGIRRTTFIGGALASGGMFISSFCTEAPIYVLYLTYSILFGVGASLAYTPSLVILGHYFTRYIGIVNGIVTAGSSVFTIVLPFVLKSIMASHGLEFTLRCISGLMACIMLCALLFKPIEKDEIQKANISSSENKTFAQQFKGLINVDIWHRKKYVIWALVVPLSLFGYFVPYVHIGKFVQEKFPGSSDTLPVMCIGITSGLGRLIFGLIADFIKIDKILLQQISFLSIGVMTMLLAAIQSYWILIVLILLMGLFDGCFISLLGPIAFELCGNQGATQAIGFLLGLCSIPITVGAPIAGRIYDQTNSYDLPFLLAGIPPILGALVMFSVRCVHDPPLDSNTTSPIAETTSNGDIKLPNHNSKQGPPSYIEAINGKRTGEMDIEMSNFKKPLLNETTKSIDISAIIDDDLEFPKDDSESLLEAIDRVTVDINISNNKQS